MTFSKIKIIIHLKRMTILNNSIKMIDSIDSIKITTIINSTNQFTNKERNSRKLVEIKSNMKRNNKKINSKIKINTINKLNQL
jgi:hypothetical protein